MKSQWEAFLQNLGEWQGSFTRLSPQGEILEDIPSTVSFQRLNDNQTIRQIVHRQGQADLVLEFSTLGKSVLFFDNGAFSQGSIQLAPFSEFGAELGLIEHHERLRVVQLFNKDNALDRFTLIREYLAGTQPKQRPPLKLEDLLGEWQGEAVTIYPDRRSPDSYSTRLQLQLDENGRLKQSLSFDGRVVISTASINDSILLFDQNPQHLMQVLLLPNGVSVTSPLKVQLRQPFFLEVGWLLQYGLRQRMIRSYNDKGEWVSLTLVKESQEVK